MAASNKKRKLATGDQETDSAEIGKPTSSNTRSAAASSSSSSPSLREIAAFSLESVQASARSATAAALTDASAADVDSMLADAQVHFLTPDKASWVYHVPRWYRYIRAALAAGGSCGTESDAQWFEEIWRLHPAEHDTIMMFGRAVPTPRFQQAYGESYRFSGNTFTALPVPGPLRACVETLQAMVADAASGRSYLRGALVNWYADGEHYIGPHSDGEASLLRHSPVLSLSLGAARRFVFTAKKDRPEGSVERLELLLQDGDLVVMGGTTQQTHKHALPKMKRCLKKPSASSRSMGATAVVAVVGSAIALVAVALIVYFVRRLGAQREEEAATQAFFQEPADVYREELNDSFMEHALWRCAVCHFRNHPERKLCDLCQTVRGADGGYQARKNGRLARSTGKMGRIGESEAYHRGGGGGADLASGAPNLSKLQLAASRRQQWKRMPTTDGLHRWVRQEQLPPSSSFSRHRESLESDSSVSGTRLSLRYNDERESNMSVGYIRVRDSVGRLVLNESDVVATDFHYRINILDGTGTSELIMNLEGVHNLPFTDKIRWFSTEIHRLWLPWESGHAELVVRRDHLLQDSFELVRSMKPYQLRQRWRVVFAGEPGLDAGGVMREWFTLLFSELFDPKFGLFVSTVGDERSYWINTYSPELREDHLAYFEFAGRLLGKAILEEHLVTVHLALPFLKHILGVPISFSDLQFLDDEIYNSALMVKKIDDIEPLCLDFTVTRIVNGKPEVLELIDGGSNIDVTRANRREYLDMLFKYHVLGSVSEQLLSFLTALYDVVPEGLLKLFDYQELELLMCGVPSIDVEDWKKHTDFKFYTHNYPTELELSNIHWFWEVIEEMKNEDRVRLLQFATGTSRVPAQGFKGLICSDGRVRRFNIAFAGVNQTSLFPKAHTCFNRLDLPIYNTKDVLAEYLKLIVQMDITGFTIE